MSDDSSDDSFASADENFEDTLEFNKKASSETQSEPVVAQTESHTCRVDYTEAASCQLKMTSTKKPTATGTEKAASIAPDYIDEGLTSYTRDAQKSTPTKVTVDTENKDRCELEVSDWDALDPFAAKHDNEIIDEPIQVNARMESLKQATGLEVHDQLIDITGSATSFHVDADKAECEEWEADDWDAPEEASVENVTKPDLYIPSRDDCQDENILTAIQVKASASEKEKAGDDEWDVEDWNADNWDLDEPAQSQTKVAVSSSKVGLLETAQEQQSSTMKGVSTTNLPSLTEVSMDPSRWTLNVLRGVSDGLTNLVGGLQSTTSTATDPNNAISSHRQQRLQEEEMERRALQDAWSKTYQPLLEKIDAIADFVIPEPPMKEASLDSPQPVPVSSIPEQSDSSSWAWGNSWSSWAKSLTSTVESKSYQLVQGGVGVLETLGKKTFSVLQENDPGLTYTKRFLKHEKDDTKPNLSQLLREARAQQEEAVGGHSAAASRRGNFISELEANRALVHLEALELVSERAQLRLNTRVANLESAVYKNAPNTSLIKDVVSSDGILDRIWQSLQMNDDEACNFTDTSKSAEADAADELFLSTLSELDVIFSSDLLKKTYSSLSAKPTTVDFQAPIQEIFFDAISSLAEATAADLAYLHKLAECIIARPERISGGFDILAESISRILHELIRKKELHCFAYVGQIKKAADEERQRDQQASKSSVNRFLANIFLEAGTARNYLNDATGLLIPVLQLSCVDSLFPTI